MKPTQQEIIELAREAGGYDSPQYPDNLVMDTHDLERFATMLLERFGAGGGEPVALPAPWPACSEGMCPDTSACNAAQACLYTSPSPAEGGKPICHLMECKDIYGEPCFIQIDDPEGVEGVFPVYTHPSPTALRAEYLRGLEDAAKVCEAEWSNVAEKMYGKECAAGIRALKGKQ